jgi:serine/threonine protein kinase
MSRDGSPSGPPKFGSFEGVPSAGDVIAGKFEVERVLGAGGMGVVVAARHMQLGQRVAIKFIRGEAATDQTALGRFLREARAAVALSSEHVTKVLDVGTLETGAPYMVMEYLEGEDLAAWLVKQGPMPVRQVVEFVLQACEGLAEAHSTGIVHRDLKPSNLFVTRRRDGTPLVKVLDFGISKVADFNRANAQELTASGLVMGSPGYMSPEQVRNAKAADARSDIWALGVILYELLSGVSPFVGDTLGDTFARIISETPAPLRQLRPEVPAALAAAISQCWERRIDRRTQSVGELAANLAPFASREAALSVERILRISSRHSSPGEPGASVPGETLMAPETMGSVDHTATPPGAPSAYPETGRAWLKSGASGAIPRSSAVVPITIGATVVALGLAGALALFSRGPSAPAAASGAGVPQAPPPAGAPDRQQADDRPAPAPSALSSPPAVSPASHAIGLPPEPSGHTIDVRPDAGEAARTRVTPREPARVHPSPGPSGAPGLDDLLERRQ